MLRWLFIDMNSYFASVEQQLRPELRGKPVGVAPVDSERSCVIAASYDAKRFGIKTGTGIPEAREKCPGIVIVKARPKLYVEVHHRILRAVEQHAPIHKVYSIDEWAVRLLGDECKPARALELGQQIKGRIARDVGAYLTSSVGAAPTRLLAKTACELHKPDGLTALDLQDLPHRLAHLAIGDLPGIGPGMTKRLYRHGVTDIEKLWTLSEQRSREIWGSVEGKRWWRGFHGVDDPETPQGRSSMSHANVLAPEFRTVDGAHGILVRLLHKLGVRLRYHGYVAHGLTAGARHESGARWVDTIALPGCQDTPTLLAHFDRLWQRMPIARQDPHDPPKKVDMTAWGLTPAACTPQPLFGSAERPQRLSEAMDKLNRRWGRHTVYFGGMHRFRHDMDDKIAFGRVPDEAVSM